MCVPPANHVASSRFCLQVLNESGPRAQSRGPSPPLRVVPLFETLTDLEASRGVMQTLFR